MLVMQAGLCGEQENEKKDLSIVVLPFLHI